MSKAHSGFYEKLSGINYFATLSFPLLMALPC